MTVQGKQKSIDAWHQVEVLVEDLFALSRSDQPLAEFFRCLLDRLLDRQEYHSVSIWLADEHAELVRKYQAGSSPATFSLSEDACRQLVVSVFRSAEPQVADVSGEGTTIPLLLAAPLVVDEKPLGVIAVIQRSPGSGEWQRDSLRLVQIVANLAGDFLRLQELRRLRGLEADQQEIDRFRQRVHARLDTMAVAYEIVNEARRIVGCDRMTLAIFQRGRFAVLAISGVEKVERRSNAVRALERLAGAVAATNEPLWYQEQTEDLAPQLEGQVTAYLDQTHVREFAVLPLRATHTDVLADRNGILGVLVAERFGAMPEKPLRAGMAVICAHAALSLNNALEYTSLPLLPLLRGLNRLRRAPRHSLINWAAIMVTVVLALSLLLLPADFNIRTEGELQPATLRNVFAPADGQVVELRVEPDDHVTTGQVVLVLQSPELDSEFQRVQGACETTRKELMAVEMARLQVEPASEQSVTRSSQLAAEEQELKQELSSHQQQLELLHQERQKLEVKAPISGQVLTWDLARILQDRPVRRGQSLLIVANVAGPWVAELWLPDRKAGYVLKAQRESGDALDMTWTLATDRGKVHVAGVEQINMHAELNDNGRPGVKLRAVLGEDIADFLPGATVYAKIHCGRRPVVYVWLSDIVEHVRGWLVF